MKGSKQSQSTTQVLETDRVQFTATLKNVRDAQPGGLTQHQFPSTLSTPHRAFIHNLATKYGLTSKSYGKGECRSITVSQPTLKTDVASDDNKIPWLNAGVESEKAILDHCSKFPPSTDEVTDVLRGETSVNIIKQKRRNFSNRFAPNPMQWKKAQESMIANSSYAKNLASRQKLPAWGYRESVVSMVANQQVLLISGETGCGKTTQVPQFLLDDAVLGPNASIVCTQPRRISAMSVAERIAHERCEQIGHSVGYAVRAKQMNGKQLNFVTPGLLLRRLGSDPTLSKYNVVIIDEVHEQDKYSEFLLILLRRLLPSRPDLRLILMSATLRADIFADYFDGCPRLDIGVSMFPVSTFFLEDALVQCNFKGLGDTKNIIEPMIDWGEDLAYEDDTLSKLWSESLAVSAEISSPFPLTNNAIIKDADLQQERVSVECAICGDCFLSVADLGEHAALCFGEPRTKEPVDSPVITKESQRKAEISSVLNRYLANSGDEDDVDVTLIHQLLKYVIDTERKNGISVVAEGGGKKGRKGKTKVNSSRWTEVVDPQSGDIYYWDQKTNETKWENPSESIIESEKHLGAVLVFLPGWNEISALKLRIDADPSLVDVLVLPLHSGVPLSDQRKVFQRSQPGVVKVVLATNIAETSLTIEDVAYVIDSGRSKEISYDCHMRTQVVRSGWISKASARQRRGRAGRTCEGMCWHLFSKQRHDHALEEFKTSELLRTPLEELVLQAKHLGLAPGCGPDDETSAFGFLGSAVHPPNPLAVTNAIDMLTQLGALGGKEEITKLGELLASLPVEPRVGKMLLWAQFLGMGKRAAALAASMSSKSIFTLPMHGQKNSKASKNHHANIRSDQVVNLYTIDTVMAIHSGSRWKWCDERSISATAAASAYDLSTQVFNEMSGLSLGGAVAQVQENSSSLSALVGVALYPNLARRLLGEVNFSTNTGRKCKLATQSVNKTCKSMTVASKESYELIGFSDLTQGRTQFIANDSTLLDLFPVFFMSALVDVELFSPEDEEPFAVITVDGWMKLRSSQQLALNMAVVSSRLRQGFADYISMGKTMSSLPPHLVGAAQTVAFILQLGCPT